MVRPTTIPPTKVEVSKHTDDLAGKKKRRWKPGTVAARQVVRASRQTHPLITRTAIRKMVASATHKTGTEMRYKADAIKALREAASSFLVDYFQQGNAVRAISQPDRHTLTTKDVQIGRATMGVPCLSYTHVPMHFSLARPKKKKEQASE